MNVKNNNRPTQVKHNNTKRDLVFESGFTSVLHCRDVFEDNMVEAKAKATKFCPRGVLEVEASPRGPHPCL